jgi:hypothetical protein
LFYHGGRIIFDFARKPLLENHEEEINSSFGLTTKQLEALEAIETIAQANQLSLEVQPGDLVFINNHALMHSRETFQDDESRPRHLVRMWLKDSKREWKLPRALEEGSRRIFENKDIPEKWEVHPPTSVALPNSNFASGSH